MVLQITSNTILINPALVITCLCFNYLSCFFLKAKFIISIQLFFLFLIWLSILFSFFINQPMFISGRYFQLCLMLALTTKGFSKIAFVSRNMCTCIFSLFPNSEAQFIFFFLREFFFFGYLIVLLIILRVD